MTSRQGDGALARADRLLQEFVARVGATTDLTAELTAELDAVAVEALEAFRSVEVDVLLLKGPALARSLYKLGERRDYSDIDLIVAPSGLPRARRALESLGFKNASRGLGIDDVGRVVHAESWVGGQGRHGELLIELHRWLAGAAAPPQGAWNSLLARRVWLDLNGHQVPVLNESGLALHLAIHAAQHGSEYARGIRELRLGLVRWPTDVWREAAGLAAEIDATQTFAAGLRLVPEGADLASSLGLDATDELDWAIRHRAGRPRGTFHLQALRDADSSRRRLEIVRRSLLPQRRWIVRHYPWAAKGNVRLAGAYAMHLMRSPAWAARAWRFRRRAARRVS